MGNLLKYQTVKENYKLPVNLSFEVSQDVIAFLEEKKGLLSLVNGFYNLVPLGRKKLNAVPKELISQLKEETKLNNLDEISIDEYEKSSELIDKVLGTYSNYKKHRLVLTKMGVNNTFRFGFVTIPVSRRVKESKGDNRLNDNRGIEIEYTGISLKSSAKIIAELFSTSIQEIEVRKNNDVRPAWKVKDWVLITDKSINPEGDSSYQCELVSPVLTEFSDLKLIVDALKSNGAKVNDTCGCHIHIDCPTKVTQLHKIIEYYFNFKYQDDMLIPYSTRSNYCKCIPPEVLWDYKFNMNSGKFQTVNDVIDFFSTHLDRYYELNFLSVKSMGTLEFRQFNSTLEWSILQKYLGFIDDVVSGVEQ